MTYESKALILHGEVYGWLYNGAQTVLEDDCVSIHILLLWESRLGVLCDKSRDLHKAVRTEQSKRAWKRALELRIKVKERLKKEYGYII